MTTTPNEVWVTGIGLISSVGEGVEAHLAHLDDPGAAPRLDTQKYEPYAVHPLAPVDMARQIPKKTDLRQMETWQHIGVYAAGLALEDAGIARKPELLSKTHLVVAAGSGERDAGVDAKVLDAISARNETEVLAKEILPTALRPTLFLAQLSNLLAGNISIVHNVTASSRTFMGEEMAGLAAVEDGVRRIAAGQAEVVLVGGALNAEREDLLLGYELGCNLWPHPFQPVGQRRSSGGGFVAGSVGAFLVLESRAHASARGAEPYARVDAVVTDRAPRTSAGQIAGSLAVLLDQVRPAFSGGSLGVLSGASGTEPATSEELACLSAAAGGGPSSAIRAYGSRIGHGVEAHFPLGLALAALAVDRGRFYPALVADSIETAGDGTSEQVLVTGVGHWRGEGLALVSRAAREGTS